MRIFSQDLFFGMLESGAQRVTVTINPYLIDQVDKTIPDQTATVTLSADGEDTVTGTGPQTITVNAGSDVTYSITKTSYTSISNQKITPYSNISKNVTLSNIATKTVTINTTPSDANVKITCVETSNVTYAKTAQVETGYHYDVEVTHPNLTTTTASFITSAVTEENTHDIVMNATITWGNVTPNDVTRTMSKTYDYQNPSIDEPFFVIPCTTPIIYWKLEKPGYTTINNTIEPASGVDYIANTTIENQILVLAELHFTINVTSPIGATVSGTVYNPNNGVTTDISETSTVISETGTTIVTCHMDDVINYTVSKQYYSSVSGSQTIGSVDLSTAGISLVQSVNYVTIYANPLGSTISLSIDGQTPITATGTLNYPVPLGSVITYSATYGGVTSETRTATITYSSPNYSDTITLSAIDDEVDIITSSTTKTLQPGHYYFICIGGGASGQNSVDTTRSYSNGTPRTTGGVGGTGGGSGYITYGDFILEESTQVAFTVGSGGHIASINSGATSVDGGSSIITKVSDNTILGQAGGGSGKNGGSGGGARPGRIADWAVHTTSGNYYGEATDGLRGALGGGNGESYSTTPAAFNDNGGVGFYNEVKSYANNAGAKGTPGTSGSGGIGVSAIQSTITITFLREMNATKLQTLYNSIGGGGSGGSATTMNIDSISGNGGAGGGGGGWSAGSAGAVDSERTTRRALGGDGGNGAILIARYGWD